MTSFWVQAVLVFARDNWLWLLGVTVGVVLWVTVEAAVHRSRVRALEPPTSFPRASLQQGSPLEDSELDA